MAADEFKILADGICGVPEPDRHQLDYYLVGTARLTSFT
jgi:hypothetical protein